MKYTAIKLKEGSAYLVSTPEYATEPPMDLRDKVKQLEADKLELSKAIVKQHLEYNPEEGVFICIHCLNDSGIVSEEVYHHSDCIVNIANKYIKEND